MAAPPGGEKAEARPRPATPRVPKSRGAPAAGETTGIAGEALRNSDPRGGGADRRRGLEREWGPSLLARQPWPARRLAAAAATGSAPRLQPSRQWFSP